MTALERLEGTYGHAEQLPVDVPTGQATVANWLVTSPGWHPFWGQYMAAVQRLAHADGIPDAVILVPGATHEVNVVALNPGHGPYTREGMDRYWQEGSPDQGKLPLLLPVNIAEQFTATDEEAALVLRTLVRGVIAGKLNPETEDSPSVVRSWWRLQVQMILEHLRGMHDEH